MTLGPQEIVRSEVEGGLSGPANSLTAESIDCGCGRFPLPQLAKFATRRIFLALLCTIGVLQGAAQAYFYVTSSTIARRFQIHPYIMEWVLCSSEITLIVFGILVAYLGDKFHRAAWLGALTLIQCAVFFTLIIPHLADWTKVIEEPENVTHMSIFAEESPDLCMRMSSRLISLEDPPHYSTLFILIVAQAITAMANVAYYALGISYIDDNTKRIHVSVYLGVLLATKILGSVLGYVIGWGCLRIDADDFSPIKSYRDQIGAWWLGWPIFSLLLVIPGFFMAIFPRKLPSEMVEETAASILDQSGTLRGSQRIPVKKVGSPDFIPSILRIVTNKILILNVFAAVFLLTALVNFIANENIFLESRFYAPRPTGMLTGFGDPIVSRTITTIIKPILIALTIIITGLVVARAKPKARTLLNYSIIVLIVSAIIIYCLIFNDCQKAPIVGAYRGSISLLKYCNKDCKCSRDAYFRPICDNRGTFTYYSPCHAGCTSINYENNIKKYSNCSCVEDSTGLGNTEARDGPCGSDGCQFGWIIYEILTMLVYAAASSTLVGDLLINLRSVNVQDKALTIGYSMALLGFLIYIPGKFVYDELAKSTCQYWGINDNICHLYHPTNLGNYLCILTGALIILSILFKVGVWFFTKELEIYNPAETENEQPTTELQDMSKTQAEPLLQQQPSAEQQEPNGNQRVEAVDEIVTPIVVVDTKKLGSRENGPVEDVIDGEPSGPSRLKYGPLGPGNRRAVLSNHRSNASIPNASTDDELDSSDGSQVPRKGSVSQVSYKPLELDSDAESELSGAARKRLPSSELDELSRPPQRIKPPFTNIRFPNPDNYEDPREVRSSRNNSPNLPSETLPKLDPDKPLSASRGNFNEVGIPLVESYEVSIKGSSTSLRSPTIMLAMHQLDRNPSRELLEQSRLTYNPARKNNSQEMEENRQFRLETLMKPMDYAPVSPRPPSRDQASSGFGSLQDMREKMRLHSDVSDSRDSLSSRSSMSGPPKRGLGGPHCTDL